MEHVTRRLAEKNHGPSIAVRINGDIAVDSRIHRNRSGESHYVQQRCSAVRLAITVGAGNPSSSAISHQHPARPNANLTTRFRLLLTCNVFTVSSQRRVRIQHHHADTVLTLYRGCPSPSQVSGNRTTSATSSFIRRTEPSDRCKIIGPSFSVRETSTTSAVCMFPVRAFLIILVSFMLLTLYRCRYSKVAIWSSQRCEFVSNWHRLWTDCAYSAISSTLYTYSYPQVLAGPEPGTHAHDTACTTHIHLLYKQLLCTFGGVARRLDNSAQGVITTADDVLRVYAVHLVGV